MFPSDYKTVSTALNSGVPLTLGDSQIAIQFNRFTRLVLDPASAEAENQANKRGLLGLDRIASLW